MGPRTSFLIKIDYSPPFSPQNTILKNSKIGKNVFLHVYILIAFIYGVVGKVDTITILL
jgi:hypothetical protein